MQKYQSSRILDEQSDRTSVKKILDSRAIEHVSEEGTSSSAAHSDVSI